jgi:hypothetical protein
VRDDTRIPASVGLRIAEMDDTITVYLTRVSQYQDKLRKYKVIVDGSEIGKIAQDETLIHPLIFRRRSFANVGTNFV